MIYSRDKSESVKWSYKIRLLLILLLVFNINSILAIAQDNRPNIILILADDMGFSDIGSYGGEVQTPNLDRLAQNGLRFRQFYNNARCCPSRASLMTGLYPHQAGIGHMTNDPEDPTAFNYGFPEYQGDLNENSVTLAEVLKSAGYKTFMTGKWHLGFHEQKRWPLQRGFDRFYGILAGATNYFEPAGGRGLTYMNDPISPEGTDFYVTDAFTDYALQFINEHEQASNSEPFFLFLSYTSPHWPLQALEKDIAKYRNTYRNGWDELRQERFERMKEIGVLNSEDIKLSKSDGADWEKLTDEQKDEMDYRMAIYAAQIDRMDQNIGRLIYSLEEFGEFDNTLILFLADNGACAEGGLLGGGSKEQLGTDEGYFLTYGQSWANVSATPLREYKHWTHEGGISTPLIVHWPDNMPDAIKGGLTDQYGFLQDIMATAIDVSEGEYPTYYNESSIVPLQGKSMLQVILGKESPIHDQPIFWEHEGNAAVRYGDFKLVKKYSHENPSDWELYDISKDRSETNNLANIKPDIVSELSSYYERWAEDTGVKPWPEIRKIIEKKRTENK